jgi:hypothetical protein
LADEEKVEIKPEDRKKLVLTEGALEMALEMESVDKQMGDVREDMLDLREMQEALQAKSKQLEGKRDEIRAKFWKNIRADEKAWFRRMSESGLHIHYKRVKNPEINASQIELNAVDGADEALTAINRIFRREHNPDGE